MPNYSYPSFADKLNCIAYLNYDLEFIVFNRHKSKIIEIFIIFTSDKIPAVIKKTQYMHVNPNKIPNMILLKFVF